MSNQWKYLLGLLLPLLLACSRAGVHEALFKQVENIVNERPDSAMVLLERIEQPETLPDAEWHWGALLWTQAKDKLFIRHTSDSLINLFDGIRLCERNKRREFKLWYIISNRYTLCPQKYDE